MRDFCKCMVLLPIKLFTLVHKQLAVIIVLITPYTTIMSDRAAYRFRGYEAVGGEFFLPLLLFATVIGLYKGGEYLTKNLPLIARMVFKDDVRRPVRDGR